MIDEEALRSIEKLHQMKQGGIISEEDFETAKQDLLTGKSRSRAINNVRSESKSPAPLPAFLTPSWSYPSDNDPLAWISLPLKRFTDFKGRSCRKEFWMFQLVVAGLMILLLIGGSKAAAGFGSGADEGKLLLSLAILGFLFIAIPQLALQVRRFHDQDKSGWFALVTFVPYLGPLIIAGFMLIEGTHGENQFGPDPRDR